eukprot:8992572-Alexandrium_andersonii.AAC.1
MGVVSVPALGACLSALFEHVVAMPGFAALAAGRLPARRSRASCRGGGRPTGPARRRSRGPVPRGSV